MVELLSADEKLVVLNNLMKQYSEQEVHQFDEGWVKTIAMFKLSVAEIWGKVSKSV